VPAQLVHEQAERVDAACGCVEGEVQARLLALAVVALDDRADVWIQGELNSLLYWSILFITANVRSIFRIRLDHTILRTA
jgi:hypothetical protein